MRGDTSQARFRTPESGAVPGVSLDLGAVGGAIPQHAYLEVSMMVIVNTYSDGMCGFRKSVTEVIDTQPDDRGVCDVRYYRTDLYEHGKPETFYTSFRLKDGYQRNWDLLNFVFS